MTMAADKQDKVLNFSSEREQSGACSSSAEREKNQGKNFLNVPTLRFPEFSDEYKSTKVGLLTSKVGSGVTPKGGESVYTTSGHPFVRSQNVGNGQMFLEDIAYIDEETHNKQISTEIHEGDVLLNITGASIGRSCVASNKVVGGNVNQHVCIVRPTKDILSYYLCNLLLSDKGQKQIDSFQAGGNRQGLNFEQIKSFKFSVPQLQEQKKVSDLLSLIDERISTQIRIINELQSLIIGLEQTLLKPQSSWTSCFIGDVLSIGSGRDYKHLSEGDIPVYGTGGYMLSVNDFLYDGESVCIGRKGTIDKPLYLHCKFWTVDTLFYTYDFREILPRYCYYLFNTINWLKYNEASGVPSLSKDTIERIKISIPSIEEQKRVCDIIDSVDEKLSLENTLLEKMISLKQFLLSSLFV
jgi:type I restriction enzyme S subunit